MTAIYEKGGEMDEQTVRKIIDDWHQEIRDEVRARTRLGPWEVISAICVACAIVVVCVVCFW